MRGTLEWIDNVRETGRWDRPRFWRHPDYQETSPWSAAEHKQAFAALRVIYPPNEVRRIFARAATLPWLAPLLMDPFRPDLSGLLSLGFDAAHARIERYPDLAHRLRGDDYPGARLELAIVAALERQRIAYEYEPFAKESRRHAKRGESFPNPDLRIRIGHWVIADIKHMQTSERANRRLRRFQLVQHGQPDNWQVIKGGIELTARYARLEQSNYSEDRLDRLALRLHQRARERAEEMRLLGIGSETIGGGLLRLDLGRSDALGVPLDDPRDANRIVGRLDEGASQIPKGEPGLVIVQPGYSDPFLLACDAAREWLALAKPEVIGVVLLGDQWSAGARHAFQAPYPIWSRRAPAKVRRQHHWNRLALGLNWRWLRALEAWS